MARALAGLAVSHHPAHLANMKRATKRPEGFKKPANWTNDPVPKPAPVKDEEELSPTRYGDWVNEGVRAVDF
ncbi:MAG: DUF1674 domain-containing protein [Sphingomonadales bacterium]|nr:MAG: DUF1674 domain-containing protein [Sphingomonadales bacterium]